MYILDFIILYIEMEKDSTVSIDPNSSTDSTRHGGEASGGEEVSTDSATYATTKTSMGSNSSSSSSANQSASSNDISINLDGNNAQKLDENTHIEPNSSSSEFKTLGCVVKAESMIVKTNSFNTQDDNEEDFEDMEEYDDDDDAFVSNLFSSTKRKEKKRNEREIWWPSQLFQELITFGLL